MNQNYSTTNILNMSTEEEVLINILNSMYNDNLRQIQNLYESNNQIRQTISDLLLHNRRTRTNRNRNRNINNNYRHNYFNNDIDEQYRETHNINNNINNNTNSSNISNNDNVYLNRANNRVFSVYSSPISYLPRRNLNNTNQHSRLALEIANQAMNAANTARRSANIARNSASVARSQIQNINLNNITSNMRARTNNPNNNNTTTIDRLIQSFLEPIDIYPTAAQIRESTRVTSYGNIVRPVNTSCPISLEPFNDSDIVTIIRHCGHIFNTNEINSWFRTNCRCPVCRYDIRNYISNPLNESQPSENTENSINDRTQSQENTSFVNQDISGNLINNLTDSILNSVLNQSGLTTSNNERLLGLLDPSNNSFDVLTTLYYLFPTSSQYRI